MSDAKDTTPKKLTLSTSGKLSLSKPVDGVRPRTSGASSSVKVEVRKNRSINRVEATVAPKMESPNIARPNADGDSLHSLSSRELEVRRNALKSAAEGREEEEKRLNEERDRLEQATRKREESRKRQTERADTIKEAPADPAEVVVDPAAVEAVELKEARAVKKKTDWSEKDFEEEKAKTAKPKAVKKEKEGDWLKDEDFPEAYVDTKALLEAENFDPTADLLSDEVEFEDYSEEIEEDQEEAVVAVAEPDKAASTDVVRSINSSERIIVAAADPEKMKKYQRSEAPVEGPRKRNVERSNLTPGQNPNQTGAAAKRQIGTPKKRRFEKRNEKVELITRDVVIPVEGLEVGELANRMTVRVVDVVKALMKMGEMVTQNDAIDAETAQMVAEEFGHSVKIVSDADVENVLDAETEDSSENMVSRPPVVTVMGHVDHGKTSLLDTLRQANVVAGEAGGITQHIAAYQVKVPSGDKVTFLDTPGHAAFTAMRMRGASSTDIVILVVAADDGIKEQTIEAISHAKAAGAPIIVAVNKIDKEGADPQRVRNELMQHELVPEDFGGDVMCVDVSAKEGQNIDKLLEAILLQAEVMELKGNVDARASGVVVEGRVEKGRGVMATVLVQRGTMKAGDIVVAGKAYGKVRSILSDQGKKIKEATPSMPVELLGLSDVPEAGEPFGVVESEREARSIADYRIKKDKTALAASSRVSLEDLFAEGVAKVKELPIIVKADVHGSAEAIVTSLQKIESDEVKVRVLHTAVGGITESDVTLAQASGAIILGFNVRANGQAKELASAEEIDIKYYSVIYNLVDDVRAALTGMLAPEFKEDFLGYAEIREVFHVSKVGKVGGCMVTSGVIRRGCKVRLLRDNVVIHEGSLKTLKRFKDDAKEVKEGFECGAAFENYDDIRAKDQIECFELVEVTRTL